MQQLNDLLGYSNRKIYQNSDWFAFSLDSVLLANFVTLRPSTKKILDIGTGTAPIPLILSLRTKAKIVGIEIQKDVASLAWQSVLENKLEEQINIIGEDVKEYAKTMEADSFDVIVCNPPYFKITSKNFHNQDIHKTLARHEVSLQLESIFGVVRKLLKNNGTFALVHRTERMMEILKLCRDYGLEPKKIQFVYPKVGTNSNIILIEAAKHGKPGIKVVEPLVIHDQNNNYSEQYQQFLKEE